MVVEKVNLVACGLNFAIEFQRHMTCFMCIVLRKSFGRSATLSFRFKGYTGTT